jgi:hypothetical protein
LVFDDAFTFNILYLQIDPDSGGFSDDWGVAAYEFTCRGPGLLGTDTNLLRSETGGAGWGDWGKKSDTCDVGSAICAFKTRLVGYQGWAVWDDDVAIVDTNFYCCNYESRCSHLLYQRKHVYLTITKFSVLF